ncbi:unnamed protein product [Mytilus coruscus]|uniref:G-protein coupled receptors family 2 profile 2 domain-containing protein n=1 Tax=Mytilus coruscus TaxID=42192 RepID=A0A6J8EP24_MYTCO|nr:unnamed protein product [Mytilus coruscus]
MTYYTVRIIFLLYYFFQHTFVLAGDIGLRSEEPSTVGLGNNARENYSSTEHTHEEKSSVTHQTKISDNQQFIYSTSVSPYKALVLSDPCYQDGTCEVTQTQMEEQYCNCDKQCHQFKDCCNDIKYNEDLNSVYTPYYQCYKSSSNIYKGLFAVAECPPMEDNTTVLHLCQSDDFLRVGPCVVNDDIIFKNKYCALCHNFTLYKTFNLMLQMVGLDTSNIHENMSSSDRMNHIFRMSHGYQLVPPKGTVIRPCILQIASNNDTLCQMFINPVYIFGKRVILYRNYFCAPVANRHLSKCTGHLYDRLSRDRVFPMTVLFSFTEKETKTEDCNKMTYQMNGSNQCDLEIYTNLMSHPETFYLVSSVSLTRQQIIAVASAYCWTLTKVIDTEKVFIKKLLLPNGEKNEAAKINLKVVFPKPSFLHELKQNEHYLNNLMWNMFWSDENNTIEISKEKNLPLTLQNETLHETENPISTYIIKDLVKNGANISRSEHLGCKKTTVFADKNGLFKIQVTDAVCHEYHINQDFMEIQEVSYSIKAILTYVCFSVSVVALVFSIIMNRKFNLSSSIAGSNMENISISLIASNILFMIGSYASKIAFLCYTIGVFLHYLWLTVFSFMLISVLYIAKNLTSMKTGNKTMKQTGNFTKHVFTITGLLIPVLFVGPAVILDQFDIANLSAGYGNLVCFPNRYPANLIFFSGPVVFSTLINFVVMLRVIVQICLLHVEMRHLIKSSSFQDAKLFFRLLLLSGIFWVIGFLSGILQSEWLEYIFILLCGLQGLFVCVANMTTRHMYGNIKGTFSTKSFSTKATSLT